MNSVQTRSAERALSGGTWLIVCGAMLYSILTVTPLMAEHTAEEWQWTAPIRMGGHGGRWPVILRWMTGLVTLAVNTADSALN